MVCRLTTCNLGLPVSTWIRMLLVATARLGTLPDDRKNSTSASSKRHPHERKLLTSSPRQVPDRSDFEDFPTDQTALSIALSRRRSRRLRKSVIGQCWNVSAYLSLIACRPKTIASGVTKTASSVNSAAAAAASLLLYASSSFPAQLAEDRECIWNPEEITLLGYSRIGCVLLLRKARQGKADCQSYKGK